MYSVSITKIDRSVNVKTVLKKGIIPFKSMEINPFQTVPTSLVLIGPSTICPGKAMPPAVLFPDGGPTPPQSKPKKGPLPCQKQAELVSNDCP